MDVFKLVKAIRGKPNKVPGPLKSVLEKALDEVSLGNPEEGEG